MAGVEWYRSNHLLEYGTEGRLTHFLGETKYTIKLTNNLRSYFVLEFAVAKSVTYKRYFM